MNFVVKAINQIIIIINKLIDGLDKKTVSIIRNSFFGLVFILVIIGIVIGYNKGKGSAKKFGKSLTESTNDVFTTTFNSRRSKGQFRSMLETELIEERKNIQLSKVPFPARETIKTEIETKVIEPDADIKKNTSLHIDNQKIPEIKRTDETIKKADVRELKKEYPKIKPKNKAANPIDTNSKIIDK